MKLLIKPATPGRTGRHLAILHLLQTRSDKHVFRIITDPGRAEDAAVQAIQTADLDHVRACPALTKLAVT